LRGELAGASFATRLDLGGFDDDDRRLGAAIALESGVRLDAGQVANHAAHAGPVSHSPVMRTRGKWRVGKDGEKRLKTGRPQWFFCGRIARIRDGSAGKRNALADATSADTFPPADLRDGSTMFDVPQPNVFP
jgi:hypothetical protein